MASGVSKILIVHTWGIGDWLFFTPVLRALKDDYPGASIAVLLGTPGTRNIVEFYPSVEIIGVADVRKGSWEMIRCALKLRRGHYDVLLFTAGVDSRKADKMAFLIRAEKKVALKTTEHRPLFLNFVAHYDNALHRVQNNLNLAQLIQLVVPKDAVPYLPWRRNVEVIPGSVLIHPGSDPATAYKRWPAEKFALVAEELLARGRRVSVILGPAELDLAEFFSKLHKYGRFRIYSDMPLRAVLEVISTHELFFNSDSGLGHIAAALNRRIVTIYGPEDPGTTRPYAEEVAIIKTSKNLDCMPCIRPGGRLGCSERHCLADIEVGTVMPLLDGSSEVRAV
jgi:heptosyltransferase-2